jgi:phage-related protein
MPSQYPKACRTGPRTPQAGNDLLRDGIHELRVGIRHVNYRILYFFHGRIAAILAHGMTKEDRVPASALDIALARKRRFEQDPVLHTFRES